MPGTVSDVCRTHSTLEMVSMVIPSLQASSRWAEPTCKGEGYLTRALKRFSVQEHHSAPSERYLLGWAYDSNQGNSRLKCLVSRRKKGNKKGRCLKEAVASTILIH